MRSLVYRIVARFRIAARLHSASSSVAAQFLGVQCPGILRPRDQAVVAAGTCLCLLAMAATWLAWGGAGGRLKEPGERPRLSAAFHVDINMASLAELRMLPSIGDVRAQQIISERQRGPFASPDDLARRIKGIGVKTVAKMKPYLAPMNSPGELVASLKGTVKSSSRSRAKTEESLASATMPRRARASPPGPTSE